MADIISKRAEKTLAFKNFKRIYVPRARANRYDAITNPTGIIDIGGAENKLCSDILLERLSRSDMTTMVKGDLYYPFLNGTPSFREAIANFLNERLKTKQRLSAENMIVTSGVGAALDMLAHAIGDPGDCVMTPAPLYTRIKTDIGERPQLKSILIHTDEPGPDGEVVFKLTMEKIKETYEQAKQEDENVVGILLINPHNPTGEVFEPSLIEDVLAFAAQEQLHVILDEIYALSVFDQEFQSSVTHMEHLPDPSRTHFVWGFSKDISLSGYRIGVIHSWSPKLISSLIPLAYYNVCPAIIQRQMTTLLNDTDWWDNLYFPTNYSAMRAGRDHVMGWLDKLNISYTVPTAAFFLWADLSKYMTSKSDAAELVLFEKLFDAGVYIEPAQAFYARTPGFFRILFTIPQTETDKAFQIILKVLNEVDNNTKK